MTRSSRRIVLSLLICALEVAACGDGAGSDAGADVGVDVGAETDAGADADAVSEADAEPDAESGADSGDGGAETDAGSDAEAVSDVDADAGTDAEPPCVVLQSGTWTGSGGAFPMTMSVQLTMNAEACSFTLRWSMDHGANADGGTIVGDTVTLYSADSTYYASCVGTADSTTHVAGVCSEDGASFDFTAR